VSFKQPINRSNQFFSCEFFVPLYDFTAGMYSFAVDGLKIDDKLIIQQKKFFVLLNRYFSDFLFPKYLNDSCHLWVTLAEKAY